MPVPFPDPRRRSRADRYRPSERLTALYPGTGPHGAGEQPDGETVTDDRLERRVAQPRDDPAGDSVDPGDPVDPVDSGGPTDPGGRGDLADLPDLRAPAMTVGAGRRLRGAVRQRLTPLLQRWVPAPLSEARWDPGRPGALMLSVVSAMAAVVAAVGVWWQRPVPEPIPPLPMVPAVATTAPSTGPPAAGGELVVSVVGKVADPGLVEVADGARVADALEAAGGPLQGTDVTALNLARRLSDGEQLWVGVDPPPGRQPAAGAAGTPAPGRAGARLDLNSATVAELETLPGIGPVTAQRIVEWRAAHGRFTAVDQLLEVSGIGDAKLAQLEGLVRV